MLNRARQYPNTLKIRIGYRCMYFILSRSNRQCSSAETRFQSKNKKHTLTPRSQDGCSCPLLCKKYVCCMHVGADNREYKFLAFNYIKYMCCACGTVWAPFPTNKLIVLFSIYKLVQTKICNKILFNNQLQTYNNYVGNGAHTVPLNKTNKIMLLNARNIITNYAFRIPN